MIFKIITTNENDIAKIVYHIHKQDKIDIESLLLLMIDQRKQIDLNN